MRMRHFAAALVPAAGLGTWNMEHDGKAVIAALRAGLDLGFTHIDTAEMNGDGVVEERVGVAIEGRRDEAFLVTKVLPRNASRQGTRRALEASLRRLRTEVVDSYLLHWRGPIALAETMDAMLELRAEGKTRSIGVSNFDENDVDEVVALVGPGVIACNQVLYHLQERAIEHAVIPTCARHGIAVTGYSPFCSGSFPAKDPTLVRLAKQRGATTRQIALAFLLRFDNVLTIPKSSRVDHVQENVGAGELALDADEIAAIEAAFPLRAKPTVLPTI